MLAETKTYMRYDPNLALSMVTGVRIVDGSRLGALKSARTRTSVSTHWENPIGGPNAKERSDAVAIAVRKARDYIHSSLKCKRWEKLHGRVQFGR